MLDLSGLWHLSDETGQYTAAMVLPGDGISALRDAGVIPDPYWGRNEHDLRWISERDWLLTRTFRATGRHMTLVLPMLDTVVDVSLNGKTVLNADSMFRTHRVDVSDALLAGENVITLHFRSAPRVAKARADAQPFPVPFQAENCPIPHGNMLRKPECDFGWDWNIALATFGLYGDIRLEPHGPRIADVVVAQRHAGGHVVVDCTVHGEGIADGLDVSMSLCGERVVGQMAKNRATLSIEIKAPELWWPVGQGLQVLHDLVVSVAGAKVTRRVGLRDIELVTTPDDSGAGFALHINGRPVFMKGANWIPADALAGAITPDGCRDLLHSAVDANMNMIRIWGGGRYEPDWFYDLCDEMGLLVWHDFMFACHLYASTDAFLADIDGEVREQVARLNHHACIALWCGDNELLGALNWYPESRAHRDRYLVAYDRLNRTIETALKDTAPTAIWWPSSPSPGLMDFSDNWHDDRSGDMHFWSVWHEGRDFEHYRDVRPRFCSEFGFQSYPSTDVIRRFAEPADFNIASPVMESHQKNAGGNARIAETMFRYFRFPNGFEDFVYLSQVQQALAIKTAVTHWRGLKPHCMGTLYWQLNDTWPVCSWSSLDHGGGWKLLHYAARRFYADVTVVALPEGDQITLRAVNDTAEACDVDIEAFAVAPSGQMRLLERASMTAPTEHAASILSVSGTALTEDEVLWFDWTVDGGDTRSDHFAPRRYKSYPLVAPCISTDIVPDGSAWRITFTAQHLALFAAVEADQPGRFSDNCFDLAPDRPVTIRFQPRDGTVQPTFTLRDLHSATYHT
ncbi:beta-mannosidase [Tateyamaria omphalii]|uniref:beta-mannosidase n=1 Tax=Tateyamaria omphalii TaxID=299262 RepID=A0A1P8MRM8_9RHOB|nr:glycoside hydrolase family 2 protein [Tateyamaria omphalii]APX10737.1 beta-mannosidase [Tateyamaria omphalii]